MNDRRILPRRRQDALVVQQVADETLIYDERTQHALCLNPPAALIWRHCDGQTAVDEMAEILARSFPLESDSQIVLLGIDELQSAGLLEAGDANTLSQSAGPPVSRRDVLSRLTNAGGTVLLIPAIFRIRTRTALAQVSLPI